MTAPRGYRGIAIAEEHEPLPADTKVSAGVMRRIRSISEATKRPVADVIEKLIDIGLRAAETPLCTVDDCKNTSRKNGMCWGHYKRTQRGTESTEPLQERDPTR